MPSPGWYQDPDGDGWRWWDGPFDFGIDLSSRWARRVSTLVAVAAGCAAAGAGTVLLFTYLVGPFPVSPVLVIVAVPVLVVGQLWCLVILNGRVNDRLANSARSTRWWRSGFRLSDARGGLPRPVAVLFLALFSGAVLMGPASDWWNGSSGAPEGGLTDDPSACEYSSNNHGVYRCLTESEYEREQVRTQRIAAGVLLGFFVGHCGVASGEVLLRRERSSDRAGPARSR